MKNQILILFCTIFMNVSFLSKSFAQEFFPEPEKWLLVNLCSAEMIYGNSAVYNLPARTEGINGGAEFLNIA